MSAMHSGALAIALLIASAIPAATQDTGTALDIARAPSSAYSHEDMAPGRGAPSSRVAPLGIGEIWHIGPGLSENSWDFGNPNAIPGFGTLPPHYDVGPVLPRFSRE